MAWILRLPTAALFTVCMMVGAGCSESGAAKAGSAADIAISSPKPASPADPNEALHEQLSSGQFQLGATLDSIQAALQGAKQLQKEATGPLKDALAEVVDRIDSCGSTLAEHSDDPPSTEAIKMAFAKFDEHRIATIDDVNDSLAELKEVKGMVGGLTGDTPELEDGLTHLAALVDQAMEDARGTLSALGGKEQMPSEKPVTSPG